MNRFLNLFSKELTSKDKVRTKSGLHLRPCALLTKKANEFKSRLTLSANGKSANMKKLNALLALGLEFEDEYTLYAKGSDANKALDALSTLLKSFKDEEMRENTRTSRTYKGKVIKGETICGGIAIAKPFIYVNELHCKNDESFDTTINRVKGELKSIKNDIFEAQLAILESIEAKNFQEFEDTMDAYIKEVLKSANRTKADDYKDIKNKVLKSSCKTKMPDTPFVLIAESLLPSDIVYLSKTKIAGALIKDISPRSHAAMLLRGLGIPTLQININEKLSKNDIIIDAQSQTVVIAPQKKDIALAKEAIEENEVTKKSADAKKEEHALTKDGKRIKILANVHDITSATEAKNLGAEGIGLLRSEFIFKETQPTFEEQVRFYEDIFALFDDVCVRTLDVGGDKKLPFITIEEEQNPFLGIRGIRLLQTHRDIIAEQLKAIFKASEQRTVKIMFPMIATPQEFKEAKTLAVTLAKKENIDIQNIQFGIMIEVPSILFALDAFDAIVDFYSIGTNDLAQYLFAIDRTHKTLQIKDEDGILFKTITKIAKETTKPLSICGELASDPKNSEKLLKCGLEILSITPKMIPQIKERIRNV